MARHSAQVDRLEGIVESGRVGGVVDAVLVHVVSHHQSEAGFNRLGYKLHPYCGKVLIHRGRTMIVLSAPVANSEKAEPFRHSSGGKQCRREEAGDGMHRAFAKL